jgi:hypothetical protein
MPTDDIEAFARLRLDSLAADQGFVEEDVGVVELAFQMSIQTNSNVTSDRVISLPRMEVCVPCWMIVSMQTLGKL